MYVTDGLPVGRTAAVFNYVFLAADIELTVIERVPNATFVLLENAGSRREDKKRSAIAPLGAGGDVRCDGLGHFVSFRLVDYRLIAMMAVN
jgi:hypothetical protein